MCSPNQNEAQIDNISRCCLLCTVIDATTCPSTQMRRYRNDSDVFQQKADLIVIMAMGKSYFTTFCLWLVWYFVCPTMIRIVEWNGVTESDNIWLIQMLLYVLSQIWRHTLIAFLAVSLLMFCLSFVCTVLFSYNRRHRHELTRSVPVVLISLGVIAVTHILVIWTT